MTNTTKEGMLFEKSSMRTSWPVLCSSERARKRFEEARKVTSMTPDVPDLARMRGHPVFVYGTLKSGHTRSSLLDLSPGARFISMAITNHTYSVWYHQNRATDRFPILLPPLKSDAAHEGHVVGELWLMRPELLYELDQYERNGHLYKRLKMSIQLVSKPKDPHYQLYSRIFAFGYMGIRPTWQPYIEDKSLAALPLTRLFSQDDKPQYINFSLKYGQPSAE